MNAPMTPERLAEIRDWLQGRMESGRFMPIGEDMARELLAEVDRLRAQAAAVETVAAEHAADSDRGVCACPFCTVAAEFRSGDEVQP